MRRLLAAGVAVACLAAGCGDRSANAIGERAAVAQVEQAAGAPLRRSGPIDVGGFANVTATYTGSAPRGARILLVVFDSEAARAQLEGAAHSPAPRGATVVARHNLVVIVDGPGAAFTAASVRRALQGLRP